MAKVALLWFDQDLRIHDHPALQKIADQYDRLICVYCDEPSLIKNNRYGLPNYSVNRRRFLAESLQALDEGLQRYGQRLIICHQSPVTALAQLINRYQVGAVFRSRSAGCNENNNWQLLQKAVSQVRFEVVDSRTLFDYASLDAMLQHFPKHFKVIG